MSTDLESQLNELGPEYRAVVARLRSGREVTPSVSRSSSRVGSPSAYIFRLVPYLTAASLLLLMGLGVLFLACGGRETADVRREVAGAREYQLAVLDSEASMREMIATQNADGSWKNDFLTRRNADTLKRWGARHPAAHVAYKKALRNLRVRGLL